VGGSREFGKGGGEGPHLSKGKKQGGGNVMEDHRDQERKYKSKRTPGLERALENGKKKVSSTGGNHTEKKPKKKLQGSSKKGKGD